MSTNALSWNFNPFNYLPPPSGYTASSTYNPNIYSQSLYANSNISPYLAGNSSNYNQFSNYNNTGSSGFLSDVNSLCNMVDKFTAKSAPIIAQAKAYKDQMLQQNFSQSQQTANQNQNQTQSDSTNQLSLILKLLGTGGTAGTNKLNLILSLLGLGDLTEPKYTVPDYSSDSDSSNSTDDTDSSNNDAFWDYIDSKAKQSKQKALLQSLLSDNE